NLSAPERKSFEINYLTNDVRREKLRFAETVRQVAGGPEKDKVVLVEAPNSFWQIWNVWRGAFVGAAAILLLGTIIFFWLNSRGPEEIAHQPNNNQSPSPKNENQNTQMVQNVEITNKNINSAVDSNLPANKNASPASDTKPAQTPKNIDQSAPALATFTLLPGTLRDTGEQFIKILPNTEKVTLRLTLP